MYLDQGEYFQILSNCNSAIWMKQLINDGEGRIYLYVLNHWEFVNANWSLAALSSPAVLYHEKICKEMCAVIGNCIDGGEKNPEIDFSWSL